MVANVCSIDHLREVVSRGRNRFFIALAGGLRPSKWIELKDGLFAVFNEIDCSEDLFTDAELSDQRLTNIGRAINEGRFFYEYY